MGDIKLSRADRIYQTHLRQQTKGLDHINNAKIARTFHCSREYVRQVIEAKTKLRANLMARAQQIAEENQNSVDTLVER